MIRIKISNLLGEHKMTQKQLSEATGIRRNAISDYYHETVKYISIEHLEKFCEFFKCSIDKVIEYIP